MPTILVSDTNIWIDFHRAGALEVLFRLPYGFVTTDFAFAELQQPDGKALLALGLQVVGFGPDELQALYALKQDFSAPSLADISCFHYAKTHGHVLLSGDGAVRKMAEAARMDIHGTLWLLDQLLGQAVIDKGSAARLLQGMLDAGSRLPMDECCRRLRDWESK